RDRNVTGVQTCALPILLTEKEMIVAKKILSRVERIYQISFPEEEAKYISLHIMSKGTKQIQSHSQSNLSKRVEKILKEIETDFRSEERRVGKESRAKR